MTRIERIRTVFRMMLGALCFAEERPGHYDDDEVWQALIEEVQDVLREDDDE